MMRRSLLRLAAAPLALLALVAVLFAVRPPASADEKSPVRIRNAEFTPAQAERGGKAVLSVEISIGEGWHLYPQGARSGFLWWQVDLSWYFIRGYAAIGGISSYRDPKAQFFRDHYQPWLAAKSRAKGDATIAPAAPGGA